MLAVSVEFLLGTFRGDPDGTANTGLLSNGEWPPTPARLFAAFVAADGTRQESRVTDGSELLWLEGLPPPIIHAHPHPHHQPLRQRYVVRAETRPAKNTHQEYVGRSGTVNRPGVRVALRDPSVVYRWDVTAPADILLSLRRRAARIGYLGAADSPVRVRVMSGAAAALSPGTAFVPDDAGDVVLGVPQRGDVQVLDRMYDQWRVRGASVTRLQFPALRHDMAYRSPALATGPDAGEVVAWLRLGTAVSGRRVTALTTLFKEAVLSRHQRIHGDPPAILHGHGFSERGYEIARYLALPDIGYRHSRGRIHGLALWLPAGSGGVTRQKARDAAHAIRRLAGNGIDVTVAPRGDGARPVAANPTRWLRSSRRWVTAFPAVHERHHPLDLAEVARWCVHAGLPDPVAFRSARHALVSGAVDLAPVEVNRPGRPGLPYSHVELLFAEPVAGPVVIGAARQRGFGLCVPMDRQEGIR